MKAVKIQLKLQSLIAKFITDPLLIILKIYKILEVNKISKQIENFEGLCSNLFLDFENLNMKNKNANLIDDLGRQTLKETMVLINNFVKNEAKNQYFGIEN